MEFGGDLALELGDGFQGVDLLIGVFVEAAEAAVATLVVGDGFDEMEAAEVGPEAVGDEDLGVGDLPEKEVGDALLAGGADDEVRVGHVAGVEGAGDAGLVEGLEGAGTEEVVPGAAAGAGMSPACSQARICARPVSSPTGAAPARHSLMPL